MQKVGTVPRSQQKGWIIGGVGTRGVKQAQLWS